MRLMLLMLVAALAFACACGDDDDDSSSDVATDDDTDDDLNDDLDDDVNDDLNDDADDDLDDDLNDDVDDDLNDDVDDDTTEPLDPEGDEDRDGVTNGVEESDGTDPRNPADALSWHPEIIEYPRLLLDRNGWEIVKQKILDGVPEYVAQYNRVLSRAGREAQTQPEGVFSPGVLQGNSFIARSVAFVAFVDDDPEMALKASQILDMSEVRMDLLPLAEFDHATILGGAAMLYFSQTYDLLAGFELVSSEELTACMQSLREMAARLWAYHVEGLWRILLGLTQNNHNVRFASGIGAVGMTLNFLPEAARYVNYGIGDATYFLLDWQSCDGGCQAEGPNYLDYSAGCYLPFFLAYHRFAQGETYPYRIDCRNRFSPSCVEENAEVPDPWVDPRLADVHKWRLSLVMPNGYAPNIDDANFSCGYPALMAAIHQDPHQQWIYTDSQRCRNAGGSLDLEHLALLDQAPVSEPPDFGPTILMEPAGQAILRDGWGVDDFYALVIGEHGNARAHGTGHEQPDATSFIFYALGELFAVDSGYISWTERDRVAHAWNHNLILVDGQGPPSGLFGLACDVDAYLSDLVDEDWLKMVRVNATYAHTDVERLVGMIPGFSFFTIDRATPENSRLFTWQFHVNAGGSTDGEMTVEGGQALIERPSAVMGLHLASNLDGVEYEIIERDHGFTHSGIQTHDVYEASAQGSDALFLSVEPVAPQAGDLPPVSFHRDGQRVIAAMIETEQRLIFIATQLDDGVIEIPTDFSDLPPIQSDARSFVLSVHPDTQEILNLHMDGGSYLNFEGGG